MEQKDVKLNCDELLVFYGPNGWKITLYSENGKLNRFDHHEIYIEILKNRIRIFHLNNDIPNIILYLYLGYLFFPNMIMISS